VGLVESRRRFGCELATTVRLVVKQHVHISRTNQSGGIWLIWQWRTVPEETSASRWCCQSAGVTDERLDQQQ